MSLLGIFQSSLGIVTGLFLLIFGYFAIFKTKKVIGYYLNSAKKHYLKSLERRFFLSKYYQSFTRYQYERQLRMSENGATAINIKIVGSACILMGLLYLVMMLHLMFKWKFGFIVN